MYHRRRQDLNMRRTSDDNNNDDDNEGNGEENVSENVSGSDGASAEPTTTRFSVGQRVNATWDFGTRWYPGIVAQTHDDSFYDILYDDGDVEYRVSRSRVREADALEKQLSDAREAEAYFRTSKLVRESEVHLHRRTADVATARLNFACCLQRTDAMPPFGVFMIIWGFVCDRDWRLLAWDRRRVDVTSPHIHPLAWGPSDRSITCFKRGNAATSVVCTQVMTKNRSCVVLFRNTHRQSGITIGIISEDHRLFQKAERNDRGSRSIAVRDGRRAIRGRGYRDVEICNCEFGWGLYLPQRRNDPEVCGIYREGLWRRLNVSFEDLRVLLGGGGDDIHTGSSTNPNATHRLRVSYDPDGFVRFELNDERIESASISERHFSGKAIYVAATMYESGQELGICGTPQLS